MEERPHRKRGRPAATLREETRSHIVRAARAVFGERGYEATTFQAIAARANVTSPAITHYFPTKLALYREVVERTNELVARTGAKWATREETLIGRMTEYIGWTLHPESLDNPTLSSFLVLNVLEATRIPELSGTGDGPVDITRDFLIQAVQDATERGEIAPGTDAASMADTLLLVLCGVDFYARYVRSFELSPDEIEAVTSTMRQLLQGGFRPQRDT